MFFITQWQIILIQSSESWRVGNNVTSFSSQLVDKQKTIILLASGKILHHDHPSKFKRTNHLTQVHLKSGHYTVAHARVICVCACVWNVTIESLQIVYHISFISKGTAHVKEGSQIFTALPYMFNLQMEWPIRAFTSQLQSITALWSVFSSHPVEVGGWVGLTGWLHTKPCAH